MALTLGGRGDAYDARYATGPKTPFIFNPAQISIISGGLNTNCIDLSNTGVNKFLAYPLYLNTPNARGIGIVFRIIPTYSGTPAANRVFLSLVTGPNTISAYLELRHDVTTGNLSAVMKNEAGTTILNATFGNWNPVSGTEYDMTFRTDGTTTGSAVKWDVNASSNGTATLTGSLNSSWTNKYWQSIVFGYGPNIGISAYKLVEWAVDVHTLDPTSYPLNSGNGSLNGSSRTSPISMASFDGLSNTDPGIANVRLSQGYVIAGSALTGTAAIPTAANVRSGTATDATTGTLAVPSVANVLNGVSVDNTTGTYVDPSASDVKIGVLFGAASALTGTYDGSDRHSDVGIANVRLGSVYKSNSTSNNRTGTAAIPVAANVRSGTSTDATTGTLVVPSAANVRSGISVDAGTGTLVVPTLANTKIGVSGDGGTGTYDGSERYTDFGNSNIRSGQTGKYNSAVNNRTGTVLASVAASTKIGVTADDGPGSYDGTDRNTAPVESDVREFVAYKVNSLTNNKLGTLDLPAVEDVRDGVFYDGSTKLGLTVLPETQDVFLGVNFGVDDEFIGEMDLPVEADVKHDVQYKGQSLLGTYRGEDLYDPVAADELKHDVVKNQDGVSITGSYRGADLNSAIGASDIRNGVSTTQDGATVVGTLLSTNPGASNVTNGVGFYINSTHFVGTRQTVTNILGEQILVGNKLSGTLKEQP